MLYNILDVEINIFLNLEMSLPSFLSVKLIEWSFMLIKSEVGLSLKFVVIMVNLNALGLQIRVYGMG